MKLNINKIRRVFDEGKYSKREVVSKCGFSRPTLDGLLQGADVKISTLASYADFFNKPISYFFDEGMDRDGGPITKIEVDGHGNQVNQPGTHHNSNIVGADAAMLAQRVEYLERLLEQKDKMIKLYERLLPSDKL